MLLEPGNTLSIVILNWDNIKYNSDYILQPYVPFILHFKGTAGNTLCGKLGVNTPWLQLKSETLIYTHVADPYLAKGSHHPYQQIIIIVFLTK